MSNRCPSCKEVLLTLRAGELSRCETCRHYVDADGEVIGEREGLFRTLLAEAGSEPRTSAELAELLSRRTEASAKDRAELCARHRQQHRDALDAMPVFSEIELEQVEPDPSGYRDRGSRKLTRARMRDPVLGRGLALRRMGRTVAVAGFSLVPVGIGLMALADLPLVGLASAFAGILVGSVGVQFSPANGRPIRRLTLEQGARDVEVELMTRNGDRTVRLPISRCCLEVKSSTVRVEGEDPKYHLWLRGPRFREVLAIVPADRSLARSTQLRLEDAFGLSGCKREQGEGHTESR